MSNPFEVLGLTSEATKSQVQERYRDLAFELHPDHGGNPGQFNEVHQAYKKALTALSQVACRTCGGLGVLEHRKGWMRMTRTCPDCDGRGRP